MHIHAMNSQSDTGAAKGLRLLIERLTTRQRRQSIVTALLCLLAAGSEGVGFLLLIPLLALVGISTGDSTRLTNALGLERWGIELNVFSVLALFLGLLGLRQFIVYRQRIELWRVGLDFSHTLRVDLFAALMAVEWRHFAAGTLHRHVQILTHEAHSAGVAAQQCLTLASAVVLAAVQIGVAAWLSMTFTVAALVGLGAFAILLRKYLTRVSSVGRQLTQDTRSLYSVTLNLLPMLRTAKMAGKTADLAELFRDKSERVSATLHRHAINQTASAVTIQLIAAVALAVALVVGVELVGLDALSASVLILIFARLTPLLTQVQQITLSLVHNLPAVSVTLENVTQLRSRAEAPGAVRAEPFVPPRHVIELRSISGGYADGDEGVLRDITLRVPVGALTLVTGATGAGKSTLADIAAGLLRPTAGVIMLDGRTVPQDRLGHWRARVGYVEQAATLFTGTIAENLRWGVGEVDTELLQQVLWATTMDEFIDAVGGMAGSVGEGGAKLSGGQRQRLAIARELLREPSLLILDEATSGLDPATEARILERILGLREDLAVLLISHRPTAREIADHVVELEHGRIKSVAPASEVLVRVQG
jgi:ATP-binding cassette subfamily C protein